MPVNAHGFWKMLTNAGVYKAMGKLHVPIYRATRGRIGHKTGAIEQLLLTTTGRKSGLCRTLPLTYMRDGNDHVVVASHGGNDRHPAWWLNLSAHPEAEIQIRGDVMRVTALEATGAERERLWPLLTAMNPIYLRYELLTDRAIPVVVLRSTSA